MNIIDAYTHIVPKFYLDMLKAVKTEQAQKMSGRMELASKRSLQMIDVERRLKDLDKYRIHSQVAGNVHSIDPNGIVTDPEELLRLCRAVNDNMRDVMAKSHGRIHALGNAPVAALESGGRDEMKRAMSDLGLKGFMVLTNVGGTPIDKFAAFWEQAAKLNATVYIHPNSPVSSDSRPYEKEYDLTHVLGWPFETSLILSRLVFSGITRKYPKLNIVSHHAGGMISFFAGRINESYKENAERASSGDKERGNALKGSSRPTIEGFKHFYFDTAVGGSTSAIRCACEVFGARQIVFGTDYPFGSNHGLDRLRTYPKILKKAGFSAAELDRMFESNIQRIIRT